MVAMVRLVSREPFFSNSWRRQSRPELDKKITAVLGKSLIILMSINMISSILNSSSCISSVS